MDESRILSVSDVNQYLKTVLDQDPMLSGLCIRGELSNYKIYPSGHHYFTLKDAGGSLRGVMFKGSALRLRFRPENGMKVLAFGRIGVFARDGAYQLYCEQLIPEGIGDLHVAFEQLKQKLEQTGLFDPGHKRPIPAFPQRIAIVTSAAGAAIHDMLRIIGKRYPLAKVILLPVRVQGKEAPAELCGAIRYVNRFQLADVIITGRGGGSMEDLWAFNDERLAMTIYQSQIPVISAVGHEPDVTISDYVADLRAATPSNAAELVVPDRQELEERLRSLTARMAQAQKRQIHLARQSLQALASKQVLQSPMNYLQDRRMLLDYHCQQLASCMQQLLDQKKHRFVAARATLEAMSPMAVLGRGYAMASTKNGVILHDASQLHPGDPVLVRLHHGTFEASVTAIEGGTNDTGTDL